MATIQLHDDTCCEHVIQPFMYEHLCSKTQPRSKMMYDNLILHVSEGASIVLPVRRYRVCNAARSKFKRMQKSSELKSPQSPGIKSYKITNLIAENKQRKSYQTMSHVQKYRRVNEIFALVLRQSMENTSTSDDMPHPIEIRHNEELGSKVMNFLMDLHYEL